MAMATSTSPPFAVKSADVEGLEERKEKGRGSYGAVYEVRLQGSICVAKRLHDILVGRGKEERVSDQERRKVIGRFRKECILLSSLHHPNVVKFMGVHYGHDEADISLFMEYMHMDLDQYMKTYPDIPLPYKTSILRDVAYGLAYLHSIAIPIIHCDLNAGNVLLTESLRAKIADLGVAKLFDRETGMMLTRTLCPGAQDFMPPECLDKSPKYNTKLDVFSFGHLTIYLANQEAPKVDRSITIANMLNEVDKRREALYQMGGSAHPLYSIAVKCLSDTSDQRPTSGDLVSIMEELCEKHSLTYRNTLHQEQEAAREMKKVSASLEEEMKKVEQLEQEQLRKSQYAIDLLNESNLLSVSLEEEKKKVEQLQQDQLQISQYASDLLNENNSLRASLEEEKKKVEQLEKQLQKSLNEKQDSKKADFKAKKKKKKSKSRRACASTMKAHAENVQCSQDELDACDLQQEVQKTGMEKTNPKKKAKKFGFRKKSHKRKRENAQLNSSTEQPTSQHERHLHEQEEHVSKKLRICTDHLS